MNTAGTGAMLCGYCGRPAFSLVYIGGVGYHPECTMGPPASLPQPAQTLYWSSPHPTITEDRVREIVREELKARETP